MRTILSLSRYVAVLGVISSLLLSMMLFILATIQAGLTISEIMTVILSDEKSAKSFAISGIILADMFLIAAGLYIVATGLYELFIGDLDLPSGLVVKSLDDLKDRIISIVVVVLIVTFLAEATSWDGTTNLLPYGIGVSAVILAMAAFSFMIKKSKNIEATIEATKSL